MKFSDAIELYVADMFAQGRFTSARTEESYRACLHRHVNDVDNRDPRYTSRDDVKRTLAHWRNPNSQRTNRAILVSFYDWCVEEGWRPHNPARQTRRPRKLPPSVYRLTRDESRRMLEAAQGPRERRCIFLGLCEGLRLSELRGIQGRHFDRPGWVWVSPDIGKGGRYRWLPILVDAIPVVEEIRAHVASDEYVLPAQRWRDPGINRVQGDKRKHPASKQAIYYLVKRVAKQAGIAAPVHPHCLRHAYADFVARHTGIRNAQFLLGHANVGTTEGYLGTPTPDDLSRAVEGLAYGLESEHPFQGVARRALSPLPALTETEPVQGLLRLLEPSVALYAAHFRSLGAL